MIHRVISQRWTAQCGDDLELSRPSVNGLDYDGEVVRQAFAAEQAIRLRKRHEERASERHVGNESEVSFSQP